MARFIRNKPYEGELGFGKNVTAEGRLMDPDGTFKIVRESGTRIQNVYFHLMTMSWRRFFGLFFLCFVLLNAGFALLYCALGKGQFNGVVGETGIERFTAAFFSAAKPSRRWGMVTSVLPPWLPVCWLLLSPLWAC